MRTVRKLVCVIGVLALAALICGCSKKASAESNTKFVDLGLGISIQELEGKLGTGYELSGTTPQRATYRGLILFDFLGKDENTKLTVFLNTENQTYAYAYYMYDAIDGNYDKLKAYLTGRYGEPVEGENASEQWKDGDVVYSVNKQSDYLAIGKF